MFTKMLYMIKTNLDNGFVVYISLGI